MDENKLTVSRRGFLGALTAFTAAIASGVAMPTGTSVAFRPRQEQLDLLAILKDCRVQSYEVEHFLDSYTRLRVVYRHSPKAPRTSLDEFVDQERYKKLPINVTVTSSCDWLDVWDLGSRPAFEVPTPVTSVEVVFA
jgi:hypothetical protein